MQWLIRFCLVFLSIIVFGCSKIQGWQTTPSSLKSLNARCSVAAMMDGNLDTIGKTVFISDRIPGKMPYSVVDIFFNRRRLISKLIIYSDKLRDFEIMAGTNNNQWKSVKEIHGNTKRMIEVHLLQVLTVTDRIRICVYSTRGGTHLVKSKVDGSWIMRKYQWKPAEIREIFVY